MRSLLLTFIGLALVAHSSRAQGLRAAAVKVDITPDSPQWLLGYAARQSTGVHDRIFHRILVLDDGKTQFFLVSSDLCLVSPVEYDKVAGDVQQKTGQPPERFWWSFTHTHSAPEVGPPGLAAAFLGDRYTHQRDPAYTTMVEQRLLEGIEQARDKLVPARLVVGWGFSQANINRRARDVEGETSLGLNPDGPVDRRIGLLRLDRADGSPIALIANYAIHGTVLSGANLEISGDAPGVVSEYVEKHVGAPVLFINGAAGNLAPIYSVYPNPRTGHLSQFRALLGDKILDANRSMQTPLSGVTLSPAAFLVETPMKPGLNWPSELASYATTQQEGSTIHLPVRVLKINNEIAIWSAPLELFCEISTEIRDRSPFPFTFYFGYTNGWLGYLPTKEEMKYGGYEPRVSPYTGQGEEDLKQRVIAFLQGLPR